MQAHKDWLQQGFDEGVFLLSGSLPPQAGGMVLAHGVTALQVQQRVAADPFVAADVVRAEIVEVAPGKVHERLDFLLG